MRVVYKFPFSQNSTTMQVPAGRVLLVDAQRPEDPFPTLWVEFFTEVNAPPTTFEIFGTGHEIPPGYEHAGSCVCANGSLVWHIYQVRDD